jgi:hypothetical protein
MSATAQKRSVPPPVPSHILHCSRGPVIEASRHRSTLLPPPNPNGPSDGRVPALSELVEQIVDDSNAVEIESDVARAPELQDTLVPDSSIVECAARLSAEPPPPSRFTPIAAQDRAELDIQDYSLRLDNPYAASSLVPPKPGSWGRTVLLVVTGALAAVASLAGSTMLSRAPVAPRSSEHPSRVVHEAPVSPTPLLSQEPISEAPPSAAEVSAAEVSAAEVSAAEVSAAEVSAAEVSAAEVSAAAVSAEPITVNATQAPRPAARAEKRGSSAAQSSAPSRPRRVRPGRKTSPVMGDDTPAISLPVTPTREQVVAGFSQIRGELARCAGGKSGVVEIQATILSSGRISTAIIRGAFDGTAEGSCMARAARLANFARFSQPTLKVRFPMAL